MTAKVISFRPLKGQVETDCPEQVVVRDRDGEFELAGPCGRADCVSPKCRAKAAHARQLVRMRREPDIFGPECRIVHDGGIPREEHLAVLRRLDSYVPVYESVTGSEDANCRAELDEAASLEELFAMIG